MIRITESTWMNKFGWFDLNEAFFLPNKIAECERLVHSHLSKQNLFNIIMNSIQHM